MAPGVAKGDGPRGRYAVAGAVAAAVALGATELVAGALPGTPSLVRSVAGVVIDLAPIGVVRAAIATLGSRDKPVLVAGVVVLSLLFGAGLALAARRRHWAAVAGLAAFGALGAWAGARPPGMGVWRPALAALVGVLAGVTTLGALAWRPTHPAPELTRLPAAPAPEAESSDGPAAPAPEAPDRPTAPAPEAESPDRPGVATPEARRPPPAGTGGAAVPSPAPAAPSALEVASRRSFLVGAGSLLAVGAAAAAGGRLLESRARVAARQGLALPRLAETAGPAAAPDLDVPGLSPFITPTKDFYRVDTATVPPLVQPRRWRLEVGGMVAHPFHLSYDELLALPMEEHDITLVCVSNEVGDRLSGNARWRGVRLDELLRRAGPQPGATQLVGVSLDGFTTGFPTAMALDGRNALVAVAMNGEPLPDDHGFPARLVVPGVYGYASACKWLHEIRLDRLDAFDPYWMDRGWATGGQMKTMARIDTPVVGRRLSPGKVPVAGVAWSHHVGISKVEVQVDGGSWVPARLGAGDLDTWRQWVVGWDAPAGSHTIRARATGGDGQLQTSALAESFPSGATGWHTIQVLVA
jgi:DMSO/TMAO reductase YedYZ molybdopterin-dependent catalytic subunit